MDLGNETAGGVAVIIDDDRISSLADSQFMRWDLATTWCLAVFRRQVSINVLKLH